VWKCATIDHDTCQGNTFYRERYVCVCVCVCVCVHQEVKMPRWAAMFRYWQKFSKVTFIQWLCISTV
jgi:hypothetical protein